VVLVAVVAAVVALRSHPAPAGPDGALPAPTTTPAPVIDARARNLTAAFLHAGQVPAALRITADPGNSTGFQFERYIEPELGLDDAKYSAQGLLVRASDHAVLDHVTVTVAHLSDDDQQTSFGRCEPTGSHDGSSCTQRLFPDGTRAKVVRNPAFAQSVASEVTTGARPGIQTQLDAVFSNRTLLVITLDALNGAGIPMEDAAMMQLATIPGVAR
jgi:hypothetical protein